MVIKDCFSALVRACRRFRDSERAAVTVEFVISVPLLMAVLAFAVQYGYAMQVRNALDVAVRDAARYMSRAPIDPSTGTISSAFLTEAQQLVDRRIAATAVVTVNDMVITDQFAAIKATASVNMPLLNALVFVTGNPGVSRIDMVACEGWTIPETRNTTGTLVQSVSGSPFLGCPDGGIATSVGY